MTPRGLLAFCREKEVRSVDLRFVDLIGSCHHLTIPVERLSEASFEQGFGITTACIPNSEPRDRLLVPQATSAFIDPFAALPTLNLIGSLQDPITREDDLFDPRIIAERATGFLQRTGIADKVAFGSSCEFSLVDNDTQSTNVFRASNDCAFELRNEILEKLLDAEVPATRHATVHGSRHQSAIEIDSSPLIAAADALISLKYIVRQTAVKHHRLSTFMPLPIENGAGATLNLFLSLWRTDEPMLGGQSFGGLSEMAMLAIGGILQHAPALMAFCNPTTNSYKRLYHSSYSPYQIGYSQHSSRTICRVPTHRSDPKSKALAIVFPDPSANPYLAMAAILMAALDGIQNKIDPGKPTSNEVERLQSDSQLPKSLWESLDFLEQDSAFLMRGEVFTQEMIDCWLHYKRTVERKAVESAPTPAEYRRYFEC